jgi:hypothetical protein
VVDKIGLTGTPMASTIFDFYDLIHRFTSEGRTEEISRIKKGFNYGLASVDAKKHYNQLLARFNQKNDNLTIYTLNGESLNNILNPAFLNSYRSYISNIASIYDILQELDLLKDVISFAAQNYGDIYTMKEISESYTDLKLDYDPLWTEIIASIKSDYTYIQSFLNNPTTTRQINQATARNSSVSWWWTIFPGIMTVIA